MVGMLLVVIYSRCSHCCRCSTPGETECRDVQLGRIGLGEGLEGFVYLFSRAWVKRCLIEQHCPFLKVHDWMVLKVFV